MTSSADLARLPDTDRLDARVAALRSEYLHAVWAGHEEIAKQCTVRINRILDERLKRTTGATT